MELSDPLDEVRNAPVGERNAALTRIAYRVGAAVRAGVFDERVGALALLPLTEAGLDTGLPFNEVNAAVQAGFELGRAGVSRAY